MFRLAHTSLFIAGLLLAVCGCGRQQHADLTFRCGVQALAAGSPRSAIPFLSQVIASDPLAPEPRAMLAMAYALDLQPDLAVRHARLVRRDPEEDGLPGWECVAMGIAALVQHDPSRAVGHFERARSLPGAGLGMKRAVAQWLTLALLLKGDDKAAMDVLKQLRRDAPARTTALLWSVLVHGHKDSIPEAAKALREIASELVGQGRMKSLKTIDTAKADDQDLCDAGVGAIREGEFARARALFTALHQRSANAGDSQVWLALMAATEGKWHEVTERLKKGCPEGPARSRSMSNNLFSVVCALERRPHAMIQHLLIGRRLMRSGRLNIHVPAKSEADSVLVHW